MKKLKGWLKYNSDICENNNKKVSENYNKKIEELLCKLSQGEITKTDYIILQNKNTREFTINVNKYDNELMDLYKETLLPITSFPWNSEYAEMEQSIIDNTPYLDNELKLLQCAIILFEQYKLKKNIYKLGDFNGVDIPDGTKFNEFKYIIIDSIKSNRVYNLEELWAIVDKIKYS